MSNPAASAIRVAATNWSRTRSMSARSIGRGTWLCGKYGSGDADTEKRASDTMTGAEYTIRVQLGKGKGRAHYDTCDFGHAYVSVNADYRS